MIGFRERKLKKKKKIDDVDKKISDASNFVNNYEFKRIIETPYDYKLSRD